MPVVVTTIVLVGVSVCVAVGIAIMANEIRLCYKEKKSGIYSEKQYPPIGAEVYLQAYGYH